MPWCGQLLCPFRLGKRAFDPVLGLGPFARQRFDNDGPHNHHDLVAVGVVCAKLAALVRIKAALEQGAKNRRVNFRPIQPRGGKQIVYVVNLKRQRAVIIKQATIEPFNLLEAHHATGLHRTEQRARVIGKLNRVGPASFQHPREHGTR